MTATKTVAPSTYVSGFCGVGRHDRCLGAYVGVQCTCSCHTEPEPEPLDDGPRIGSLFSGYGGLEQGVQSVLGGTVAWHSEIDPGACKILAHRYPDVPNLGDITTVDWTAVEPVDVLTGGSPCQDVSAAGKRLGMRAGTRSGLWASMCDAIETIRPGLVVWENVRGVLSAGADSAVEPCPICVGDERDSHLRALGRVVGDLSELGYVGRWIGLRAADVGAPHGRFRVFVTAWPAEDSQGFGRPAPGDPSAHAGSNPAPLGAAHRPPPDADRLGLERGRRARDGWPGSADGAVTAPHAESHRRHEGRAEPARVVRGSDAALSGDAAADADGHGREVVEWIEPGLGARGDADGRGPLNWGAYTAAVHRWERRLGRQAPAPTEPGSKGQPRLSPAFVEWLMGLDEGHVTGVPGLTRNEQLKALGNGVVPQQAAAALRLLLAGVVAREVAA